MGVGSSYTLPVAMGSNAEQLAAVLVTERLLAHAGRIWRAYCCCEDSIESTVHLRSLPEGKWALAFVDRAVTRAQIGVIQELIQAYAPGVEVVSADMFDLWWGNND